LRMLPTVVPGWMCLVEEKCKAGRGKKEYTREGGGELFVLVWFDVAALGEDEELWVGGMVSRGGV